MRIDNSNKIIINNKEVKKELSINEGIVRGKIIDIKNSDVKIRLENDKEIVGKRNQIDGNIGDSIKFKVIGNEKGQINLKQIREIKNNDKVSMDIVKTFNRSNGNKIEVEEKSLLEDTIEKNIKKEQLKRKLNHNKNSLTKSAVALLIENGFNVNNIEIGQLSEVIESCKKGEEKDRKIEDNISKEIGMSSLKMQNAYDIIEDSVKKLETIRGNDNIEKEKLIKSGNEVTINNLMSSKYEADNNIENKYLDEGIEEKIKSHLKKIGIEESEENISISKKFILEDIEINRENISKWKFMNDDIKEIRIDTYVKNAVRGLEEGNHPNQINLRELKENVRPLFAEIEDARKNLKIDDKVIKYMEDKNIPFTINRVMEETSKYREVELEGRKKDNEIENKKMLLEIQYKLTSEISYSLAKRGIEINNKPLEDALREIKKIEEEGYIKAIKKGGLEITKENIATVENTITKVKGSSPFTNETYKRIVDKNFKFNIEDIYESSNLRRLEKGYAVTETVVNSKFKDSFNKIKGEILPLLKSLGIEDNDINIKASSILIKNNMEVNVENINKVSLIDMELNKLVKGLKPDIVVEMIKEGVDPLKEEVSKIIEYINKYEEKEGFTKEEDIIENILRLEKDKGVSKEQLEAVKNVYRGMNQGLKNDRVAIGSYVGTEKTLTLENILNSSKYYKKTKGKSEFLDEIIDENRGFKESEGIADKLNKELMREIVRQKNYGVVKEIVSRKEDVSLKSMYEEVIESEGKIEEGNIENIEKLKNDIDDKTYKWLEKNDIPITLGNAMEVKELIRKPKEVERKIKESIKNDKKVREKLFNVEGNNLGEVVEEGKILDEVIGEIRGRDIGKAISDLEIHKSVMKSLEFQNELNKGNNGFTKIPIRMPLSGNETNLTMYVLDKNKLKNDEVNIIFKLETKEQGEIRIDMKLDKVKKESYVEIQCDNGKIFEDNMEEIKKIIKTKNIEKVNIKIKKDDKQNENLFII